jgi:hypothetical protein
MRNIASLVIAAMLFALCGASPLRAEPEAAAPPGAHGDPASHKMGAAAPACAEPLPHCAATAEPAFGRDGALWLAYAVGDKIYAAASRDLGKTFAAATTAATIVGGVVDANGEARPKVLPIDGKTLLVSYTVRPEKSYDGAISLVRSIDGGKSFSAPQPLVDGVGQRFDLLLMGRKGRIYAAWLDKRDAAEAKAAGKEFAGSGIAAAWSDDGGKTFSGKKILMDHACECCRIGAAMGADGLPVYAWRQVFEENHRDHYVAKLSADGSRLDGGRVSEDLWATTCPHHGPSLAIDAGGAWHIVWFTNGKARKGLFYARSVDGGKGFSPPVKFGEDARAPSHAAVLATRSKLYRAWKEFDGITTSIVAQSSEDAGKTWSEALAVATTMGGSDHPVLIANKGVAYLSWLTRGEGYRLTPIPNLPPALPQHAATLPQR